MANTDQIVLDTDSATFVSEGLPPDTLFDVHYRFTDATTGKFKQGSDHGYGSNAAGALSVTVRIPDGITDGKVHMWLHTLPVLSWDDDGNPDPAYDHNFAHVFDKGDGNLAEANATIDFPF